MPPSNRFPILRLPLLPLELVIKDLTPLDIFFLATISNKTHKHLKGNPTKLETFELIRRRDDSFDELQANLVPFNEGSVRYRINLRVLDKEWAEEEQIEISDLKIKGKQYKSRFTERDSRILIIYEIHEDAGLLTLSQNTISAIYELLFDIFRGKKVSLDSLSTEVVLPKILNFYGVQELELLHLDSRENCQLTSDELSNILENLSVQNFRLKWGVVRGVKYRKSLRYPNMTLYNPRWLTIDCLLNMDCVSLEAYRVYLTVKDLKRFLQHWLDGGLEKLDCIELFHQFGGHSWSSALDNIEKKPLQYVEGQMNRLLSHNGWEIERSDGRRAGVCVDQMFIFKVL